MEKIFVKRKKFRIYRGIMLEMMAAFSAIILIVSMIMGSYYFYMMNRFVNEEADSYRTELIRQIGEKLDYYLEGIMTTEEQTLGLVIYQEVFDKENEYMHTNRADFIRNIEDELKNIRRTNGCVSEIIVLGTNGTWYASNSHLAIQKDWLYKPWLQAFLYSEQTEMVLPVYKIDDQILYGKTLPSVYFLKKITNPKDAETTIGVILTIMEYSTIKSLIENIHIEDKTDFYVLDSNKVVLYSLKEEELGQKAGSVQLEGGTLLSVFDKESLSRNYFVSKYDTKISDWNVVGLVLMADLQSRFSKVWTDLFLICFFVICFSLFWAYLMSKKITKPIGRLIVTMKTVEEGDFKKRAQNYQNEDLKALSSGFNAMLDQIELLMQNLVKKESESANARIMALQAQINPHFLYNTLETIRSIAMRNNVDSISSISKSMAAIFRYSIDRGNEEVELWQEIEHVANYVSIQKYRYKDRLTIWYDLDEVVMKSKTIKLILQPLIENAIYHGIEMKKGRGEIHVICRKMQEKIRISIKDNGVGMTESVVSRIQAAMLDNSRPSGEGMGIGIYNVNARLKLYYGEAFGLHVNSKQNEGTEVWFFLPIRLEQ